MDQILAEVAAGLEEERKKRSNNIKTKDPCFIRFVKPGGSSSRSSTSTGVLVTAANWEMNVDLKKQLNFPEETTSSTLRPVI